jgi:malonyl-CoA decarboxylase
MEFLTSLLNGVAARGRALIGLDTAFQAGSQSIDALCEVLLSRRGEASGIALAQAILSDWERLDAGGRLVFFRMLLENFGADQDYCATAINAYNAKPNLANAAVLHRASQPRLHELLQRLNLAPRGTLLLVRMREALFEAMEQDPDLKALDSAFKLLFASWFNRGFLTMERIDWHSPANVLEKIIRYEAVHQIDGWDDLRRRLEPADRRCFAFFHPQLTDEPLIFVEIALTADIPSGIESLLRADRTALSPTVARTAVFYSISNCQEGLRGISFGNFLIKAVAENLKNELPGLETFVTLSPLPGFARWLDARLEDPGGLPPYLRHHADLLAHNADTGRRDQANSVGEDDAAVRLAAYYLLQARSDKGNVIDPVARFHLGNGARLERINPNANPSPKGMRESYGVMVNYLYDLARIESNHEAFAQRNEVIASFRVHKLLASPALQKLKTLSQ